MNVIAHAPPFNLDWSITLPSEALREKSGSLSPSSKIGFLDRGGFGSLNNPNQKPGLL